MSTLQSTFFVLDLLGVLALAAAFGLTSVVATFGDGPVMRRGRR